MRWYAVHADLARLEAFGLIELGGQRPVPVGTVEAAWRQASATLDDAPGLDARLVEDLRAVLGRIGRRIEGWSAPALHGTVELEAGGGRSPGRTIPDNGVGGVDAVVNPLWAHRSGASYGDRLTAAVSGQAALALGSRVALEGGLRLATVRTSGPRASGSVSGIETASVRVRLGPVDLDVGRAPVVWGWLDAVPLLMTANGPPLDLLRVSSNAPVSSGILGRMEFSAFVADLGPEHHFAHAKLFEGRVELRPSSSVRLSLATWNKQGGEGAPSASLGARLRDLSVLWGLVFGDDVDRFSDKQMAASLRVVLPSMRGTRFDVGVVATDFDLDRIGDIVEAATAVGVALTAPRLGGSQRHSARVSLVRSGPVMARHGQFRSGSAVNRLLQGFDLGPDARRISLRYAYEPLSKGWRACLAGSMDRSSADPYGVSVDGVKDIHRIGDLPEEVRLRLMARVVRDVGDTGGQLAVGFERVADFGFLDGDDRLTGLLGMRIWRRF